MYHTIYLDERIALTPSELNNVVRPEDIHEALTLKLKEKHESKCNTNGYVRPDSVGLIARSMGVAENGRYTGNLIYDCKMKCDVLYPKGGMVMDVLVIKVTKMGVYAVFEEAIRVLVPRDIHLGNTEFDNIHEGDMITIRLERSEMKTNSPFIMAVGSLVSKDTAADKNQIADEVDEVAEDVEEELLQDAEDA
jgi:DNA-directed RNA polymerase subunit E'/Rpb7